MIGKPLGERRPIPIARELLAKAKRHRFARVDGYGWSFCLSVPGWPAPELDTWMLTAKRLDRKDPSPTDLAMLRLVASELGAPPKQEAEVAIVGTWMWRWPEKAGGGTLGT